MKTYTHTHTQTHTHTILENAGHSSLSHDPSEVAPLPLYPALQRRPHSILLWVVVEDKGYVPAMPVTLSNINGRTREEILKPGQSLQQTFGKDV